MKRARRFGFLYRGWLRRQRLRVGGRRLSRCLWSLWLPLGDHQALDETPPVEAGPVGETLFERQRVAPDHEACAGPATRD